MPASPFAVQALRFVLALRRLSVNGDISQDAFQLGAIVGYHFINAEHFRAVLTFREAVNCYTTADGYVFSAPPSRCFPDFLSALQELHFKTHLLSHYRLDELALPDSWEGHFSRDPMLSAMIDYDFDTPIHFKLAPERIDEIEGMGIRAEEILTQTHTGLSLRD